jgi:hypothetical protein
LKIAKELLEAEAYVSVFDPVVKKTSPAGLEMLECANLSPVRSFACYVGRPVHFETTAEATIFAVAEAIRYSEVKELTLTIGGCGSHNWMVRSLHIHGSQATLLGSTISLPVSAYGCVAQSLLWL